MISLNLIRNFFLSLLLTVVFIPIEAQVQSESGKAGSVSIRYSGLQNEHLVFYVQVENSSKERFRFLIRDENNNVLFEEIFSQQLFEKKILFLKADVSQVSFEVNGRSYNYYRQFAISTRTVEEVSVRETK